MLWVPQNDVHVVTNAGIVGSATPWSAVVSNGTTLLDGAIVEVISAANNVRDSWGIEIVIAATGASATASQAALDVLVGGATDDVLVSALLCGYCSAAAGPGLTRYFFPVHIPAGMRVAVRLASVRVTITARVGVWLYGGGTPPFRVGRKITTYGTQINNARGQAVVPTASGGAASVTQMTASSTEDHFYFFPGFQPAIDTTITPAGWVCIGIGVGAATEERIGTWWFGKDTLESSVGFFPMFGSFREVPAATRLTLLASNSGANDSSYDGLIYAVS